jgi:hypothetical protein
MSLNEAGPELFSQTTERPPPASPLGFSLGYLKRSFPQLKNERVKFGGEFENKKKEIVWALLISIKLQAPNRAVFFFLALNPTGNASPITLHFLPIPLSGIYPIFFPPV